MVSLVGVKVTGILGGGTVLLGGALGCGWVVRGGLGVVTAPQLVSRGCGCLLGVTFVWETVKCGLGGETALQLFCCFGIRSEVAFGL